MWLIKAFTVEKDKSESTQLCALKDEWFFVVEAANPPDFCDLCSATKIKHGPEVWVGMYLSVIIDDYCNTLFG